ncbi:hypothetical protein TSOC_012989 [Tetrabaena socialis]|uniref:Rubisco LSMT substrate-binding domain-containing protein n=1 Tax=Tetrabaena socialis TaxID=47790 RepID=A0A2J7ZLJ5_9CHLO|nr:hypothetical protein TSOC_012989 [Tetrabaena socialis]|eukprot:PNH01138.1 hypothetical protein TSOC_012989 [Tetrabaena socialis]
MQGSTGWRVRATERDVELACRVMGALSEPTSAPTERALLRGLQAYIGGALAAFPTSLAEDEARLEGRAGAAPLQGPERLAVIALASQKRALAGSAAAVAGWLAQLEGGCPLAELYGGGEEEEEEDEDEAWGEEEGEEGEAGGSDSSSSTGDRGGR